MPELSSRPSVKRKALRPFLAGLLAGLILGGTAAGAALYYGKRAYEHDTQQAQERLRHSLAAQSNLLAQLDIAESRLAVETSTRKGLESSLLAVQDELGGIQEKMAFFEELLPPGPVGTVSIRGLELQRKGSRVDYRVLLMRRGGQDAPFEGALQFQGKGRMNGVQASRVLAPVQASIAADDAAAESASETATDAPPPVLALRFEQFQRSAGLLDVPEGFELDEITVNVLEGNTVRASRTAVMPAH